MLSCGMPVSIVSYEPEEAVEPFSERKRHRIGSLQLQREMDGRCGQCGIQTHRIHMDPTIQSTMKAPLTIQGEVHRGRCLFCHPLPLSPELSASSRHSVGSQHSQKSHIFHGRCNQHALSVVESLSSDTVEVLAAMQCAPRDATIQELGLQRLWILSWDDDNAAAIGRVGGTHIVLSAMHRFSANPNVQRCACECLQNLTATHPHNRIDIVENSGIELILQAILRHPGDQGIQQSGCIAMANIASTEAWMFGSAMERAGGIQALLNIRRGNADQTIVAAASESLRAIGVDGVEGRVTPTPDDLSQHIIHS